MTKSNTCKRIFWLGMHKVLVQTELVRLRELGYEVFNPPYLSPIQDQSAHLDWDDKQLSTLPRELFQKLSNYNFFYNEISSEIAEILNTYFDAVIVTISPSWLRSIIKVYHGRLIFRTYGQHYKLSDELRREGVLFDIAGRDNFTFMPHALEALNGEHSWLKDCAVVVPYCLPPDIYKNTNEWTGAITGEEGEIVVSCPNINNSFYRTHYDFLKKNFPESYFKYFGVQLSTVSDKQVVGTLSREDLLSRYKRASGYLYTYNDLRVCYLPPIEMMVLGGPVLFLKGSLLDRYFETDAPGRCADVQEAKIKVARLLNRDQEFIDALLESQSKVAYRYHPEYVWPLFDEKIDQIFEQKRPPQAWLSKVPFGETSDVKRVYLFQHFPGQPVAFDGVNYTAYDGIPRVMRQIVKALCRDPSLEVWVTARYDQAEAFYGYFSSFITSKQQVKILIIDDTDNQRSSVAEKVKKTVKKILPVRYWPALLNLLSIARRIRMVIRKTLSREPHSPSYLLRHVNQINNDSSCAYVIVPHYYWFPEAVSLSKDIYFYLPDYMPYFFHDTGEFVENEGQHTDTGRAIAAKAKIVFCNSEFTKEYLPKSRLAVNAEKIRVFYLPVLNLASSGETGEVLPTPLQSYKYIFYPTQPRPNKNLSLLLRVFDSLVQRGYDLNLVLTCNLDLEPKALATFRAMSCRERVVFMPHVSDTQLCQLYKNAALLCFTSLAEGNFPPQIQEAIFYETPSVAVNLGFVTERIPSQLSDCLLLCKANDLDEYVKACEFALNNRSIVLERQIRLRDVFLSYDTHSFEDSINSVFEK